MFTRHFIGFLLFLLLMLGQARLSYATHLMGSDLTYSCKNDTFVFTLKVYRDCNGVSVTTSQSLNVKGGSANFNISLSYTGVKDVTPVCSSAVSRCVSTSGTYGIQEYSFRGSVYFGQAAYNSICSWTVSWTDNARNSTITSGQANQNYYTYTRFNRCLASCNNSPSFTDAPITIICTNQLQYLNMSAIDTVDSPRDSISYRFDTAWATATSACSYSSGLSYAVPLASSTTPAIDAQSGTVTITPSATQQAVVVVAVQEWRKISGIYQLISVVRRDIQIICVACGTNVSPTLPSISMQSVCPGKQLCFTITPTDANSSDSVRLSWSRNIKNATFTTSSAKLSVGTFCWTPTNADVSTSPYYFSVLARDNSCSFNLQATRTYFVKVEDQPNASVSPVGPLVLVAGDSVQLSASSGSGYTYAWYYNNAVISGATSSSYYAKNAGSYFVIANNTANCPDTSNIVVVNSTGSISSFPYYESFESSSGGWTVSGNSPTLTLGEVDRAKTMLSSDAMPNGRQGWITNLYGDYRSNETDTLTSPIFDMSSAFSSDPVLSFMFFRNLGSGDYAWVEYLDGSTWYRLGSYGSGTSWYTQSSPQAWTGDMTRWHTASYTIPLSTISNKSTIRFRFVFEADNSIEGEGMAIDDIHIHANEPMWGGSSSVTGISNVSTGSNTWIDFKSGTSRILSIKDNGFYLDSITVDCYINSGAVRSIVTGSELQYYLDRNWVINTVNYPKTPISVRLYLTEREFQQLEAADGLINKLKDMGITKYSGSNQNGTLDDNTTLNGSIFIPPASVRYILPYSGGYIVEFDVDGFSEFWVNSGASSQTLPLPVEWIAFSAIRKGADAFLEWATASEFHNDRFEVERMPEEDRMTGYDFSRIASVPGHGNSVQVNRYSFTDRQPQNNGQVYYRLKQVDWNGKFSYSPVQVVDFGNTVPQMTVAPNPFSRGLTLELQLGSPQAVSIELLGLNGSVMKHMQVQTHKGVNSISVVDMSETLPAGFYVLNVTTQQGTFRYKVIRN